MLARLLNRTLLLPPARLGTPLPWGPELPVRVFRSEQCKAGIEPLAPEPPCGKDESSSWTYVAWSYLVQKELLHGRALVDRWNSSAAWFEESLDRGGLALHKDDIAYIADKARRSYQLYDDRATATNLGGFTHRIDIEDLTDPQGKYADKRLLHFGSLFSGARLHLTRQESRDEFEKLQREVVLRQDGLDRIADEVRDLLGSEYLGVHLRVGDGVFKVSHPSPCIRRHSI